MSVSQTEERKVFADDEALKSWANLRSLYILEGMFCHSVGEPMQVTFISYLAGILALLAICLVTQYPLPH